MISEPHSNGTKSAAQSALTTSLWQRISCMLVKYEDWCVRRSRVQLCAVALLWYGFISYLSHIPTTTSVATQEMVGGSDTINAVIRFCAHLGVFGVLGVLVYAALNRTLNLHRVRFAFALGIVFCAGVLDEVHQSFIPGRFARTQDVVTDTAGAAIAIVLLLIAAKHAVRSPQV